MSLAWRVVLLNSAVLLVASLALALGPATVSSPIDPRELVVLLLGVVAAMCTSVVLVQRAFAPLRRLTRLMHTIDPLAPGTRLEAERAADEVQELAEAFNDMLSRLERERRESARRAVRAQEEERRRVARELHDELGQSLTGVLLQIDDAIRAPGEGDLEQAREGARRSLDDVRRIARDLRPDTLGRARPPQRPERAGHALHAPVRRGGRSPPRRGRAGARAGRRGRALSRRTRGADQRRPPRRCPAGDAGAEATTPARSP